MVAWVALSSMPASWRAVLMAFAYSSGKSVSVQDVIQAGSVSRHTAERYMEEASKAGLGRLQHEGRASHCLRHANREQKYINP